MSRLLVHFPVFLSLLASAVLLHFSLNWSRWLLIPSWQTLCMAIMLILDGKNRMRRYRKIRSLLDRGVPLEALPREGTICGFFIRAAAVNGKRPA